VLGCPPIAAIAAGRGSFGGVRIAFGLTLWLTSFAFTTPTWASDAVEAPRGWAIATLGVQATEWRVANHDTERGLMLTMGTAAVASTQASSTKVSQFLALGGGEGGFQGEYLSRFVYGLRFLRSGPTALVLRGGLDVDGIGTPHGGTYQVGPVLDLGFQHLSHAGFFDLSLQSVVTVFPAAFSTDSSKHPGEWFSSGPHLAAGFRSVFFQGSVVRTERHGEFRTEFHMDLCGASKITLCARLHNYRYDDAHPPSTLLGLVVGLGTMPSQGR
jgi:hypothetical protein